MYPSRFAYDAPASVAEAVAILDRSNGEAKVLAGGQSLIPMLKLRFASPERIVDINNVPGLDYLRQDPDGTLHIGALVRASSQTGWVRCNSVLPESRSSTWTLSMARVTSLSLATCSGKKRGRCLKVCAFCSSFVCNSAVLTARPE